MNAHTREPFHIRILKGLLGIIWSIDWPLMVIVLILSAWGFVALYSAGYSFPWGKYSRSKGKMMKSLST